ncbi:MAG: hypothetical protein HY778_13895 [Betaproteobacteria bacterium]|nr:hypothetical protein [Betaproteobacteria bacterium]
MPGAGAAGLGDIHVLSRIGQPLRAEIPLFPAAGETLDGACYRIVPGNGGDEIPVLPRGEVELRSRNGKPVLAISTTEAVNHPIVAVRLHVGCGKELTKEFPLLMPAPEMATAVAAPAIAPVAPLSPPQAAEAPAAARAAARQAGAAPGDFNEWTTYEGESLQSVAQALYPVNRVARQRFVTATLRANPGVFPGGKGASRVLPAGTRLHVPNLLALSRAAMPDAQEAATRPTDDVPSRASARPAMRPSPAPAVDAVAAASPETDGTPAPVARPRAAKAAKPAAAAKPAPLAGVAPAAEPPAAAPEAARPATPKPEAAKPTPKDKIGKPADEGTAPVATARKQPTGDQLTVGTRPETPAGKKREPTREEKLIMDLEDKVSAYQEAIDRVQRMEARALQLKAELERIDGQIDALGGLPGAARKTAAPVEGATAAPASQVAAPAPQAAAPTPAPAAPAAPAQPPAPVAKPQPASPAVATSTPPPAGEDEGVLPWLLAGALAIAAGAGGLLYWRRRRAESADEPFVGTTLLQQQAEASRTGGDDRDGTDDLSGLSAASVLSSGERGTQDIDKAEYESAIELAEIMLSFGRIRAAAQTLADYIDANPRHSVEPWLRLQQIYREAGMRGEYEALAENFNKTFNVQSMPWDESAGEQFHTLEGFGHIKERLVSTWGTSDCLEYLHRLVDDNRNGTRSGFPLEVLDEILMLISVLEFQKQNSKLDRMGRAA